MRSRSPYLTWLALAWVLALLSACASGPRSVDVSRQQLQSALERRFPQDARPGGALTYHVAAPRLALLPAENRVRLDFTLDATHVVLRTPFRGELGLSFGLRYEPSDASVRATDVRIERVAVPDLPIPWQALLKSGAGGLAGKLLDDTVLHTFRPEDLARAGGWRPGAIQVTPAGLHITLLPPA
jgi:hypothetical protein